MAIIDDGYILLARKVQQSDIWTKKPCWWLKVWLYILQYVNHTGNNMFNRGTNFFTYNNIYNECYLYNEGIKPETVDNLMRWLKSTGQITTQKTTRGIIITICNYDIYQDSNNYKNDTKNDTKNEIETRKKRERNDTINNNNNNDKELNKEEIKSKVVKTFDENSIEYKLSKLLLDEILKRKPDYKQPNLQTWCTSIDLMVRLDNRLPEVISKVIVWVQTDSFWCNNILSTLKLREQFDKLELKMNSIKHIVIAQPKTWIDTDSKTVKKWID